MSGDGFAAAQERIVARQTLRQREAGERRTTFETSLHDTSTTRLPKFLRSATPRLSSLWSLFIESEGTNPSFRVGQVDAELLDEELLGSLRTQFADGLKCFSPHFQDDWSQEITLLLRAVLFKLSIWDNDASYGASLQNLRYTDARSKNTSAPRPTRWQKSLYGMITVLGRYGWDKWENWLRDQEWETSTGSRLIQKLSDWSRRLTTIHSMAAMFSFLIFLINGRYRTLTDRLLRMRLVSTSSHLSREVSFEYLNRQLVWHAITEFLLFLLPIVGISRWRRWLSRAWRRTKAAMKTDPGEGDEGLDELASGPFSYLPERTCAICYQTQNPSSVSEAEILGTNVGPGGGIIGSATTDIVNPYETIPCGCIYCFHCLSSAIEAEEGSGWSCLRCASIVYKCKPWNGDTIIDTSPTTKNGKSVGFTMVEPEASKEETVETYDVDTTNGNPNFSQWSEMNDEQPGSG